MPSFKYCPVCGSQPDTEKLTKFFLCEKCGYTLFMNTVAATSAIIEYKDKILFAVRAKEPSSGKLDLPGGFVDYDETAEQALERELMEELSITLPEPGYLCSFPNVYPYKNVTYRTIDLFYTATLDCEPALKPADDVSDVRWINKNSIPFNEIAFESVRNALQYYLDSAQRE